MYAKLAARAQSALPCGPSENKSWGLDGASRALPHPPVLRQHQAWLMRIVFAYAPVVGAPIYRGFQ